MKDRVQNNCTGLQSMTKYQVNHVTQCSAGPLPLQRGSRVGSQLATRLTAWGTLVLRYSSSPAMRKPRTKSMAFCRSCDVCLPTRLGGGRIRRLAKRVAKKQDRGNEVMNKNWHIISIKKTNLIFYQVKYKTTILHVLYDQQCQYVSHVTIHKSCWFVRIFNK